MTGFQGFGDGLLDFFEGLAADNSRTYWLAHKESYDTDVAGPLHELGVALTKEFGEPKVFRPYRDLRFSKDKRPYKEHASMVFRGRADGGLYLQISDEGLFIAGGYWQPACDQIERWRRAVDDDVVFAGLQRVLRRLDQAGYPLGEGNPVATTPRGWPRDHPRIDLLRRRSLTVSHSDEPADWWHTSELLDVVSKGLRTAQIWDGWLTDHVGPTAGPVR